MINLYTSLLLLLLLLLLLTSGDVTSRDVGRSYDGREITLHRPIPRKM